MKPQLIIAIVLIVLGVASFGYQAITYTTRDRVIDAGPLHVDADKQHTVYIQPIIGGLLLAGGIGLLVAGRRGAA